MGIGAKKEMLLTFDARRITCCKAASRGVADRLAGARLVVGRVLTFWEGRYAYILELSFPK